MMKLCLTLCDPIYWLPTPRDLPDARIKAMSPLSHLGILNINPKNEDYTVMLNGDKSDEDPHRQQQLAWKNKRQTEAVKCRWKELWMEQNVDTSRREGISFNHWTVFLWNIAMISCHPQIVCKSYWSASL